MSSSNRVKTAQKPVLATMAVANVARLFVDALMALPMAGGLALVALTATAPPAAAEVQINANAQAQQAQLAQQARAARQGRIQPPTGRYVSENGERFIFDRSGSRPLFRFESRNETWVLRPSPAPRGDIIYRNDAGDQILRVTPDGGMTLYTVRAPNGSPASMAGPAPGLALPEVTPAQLFRFSLQQSDRMSEAVGHLVYVTLDLERPGHEAAVAETVSVICEAVLRLARSSTTRSHAAGIRRINVVEGTRPGVTYANGVLTVVTNPAEGAEGRPSSARIIRTIARP